MSPGRLKQALKVAVSALLLWLVFRNKGLSAAWHRITLADPLILAVALGIFAVLALPMAMRWSAILRVLKHPKSVRFTLPLVFVGQFFNQALPGAVGGDAVRVWSAYKAGVPGAEATMSVLADRLFGVLALVLLVTVTMPMTHIVLANQMMTHGIVALLAVSYLGFAALLACSGASPWLERFRPLRAVRRFAGTFRIILSSGAASLAILAYGLLNQLGNIAIVFTLALALNVHITFLACLLIVPLANLVQAVPISIAGWGLREGFFVFSFGMFGIPSHSALALSLMFGMLNLIASLPGGILWLRHTHYAPGALASRPESD